MMLTTVWTFTLYRKTQDNPDESTEFGNRSVNTGYFITSLCACVCVCPTIVDECYRSYNCMNSCPRGPWATA